MPASLQTRRPIERLSPLLANQIAAGEVVDRPASVVKELLDNALDAGAGSVTLEIEQGGIELIRVCDDGGGIPPQELPLALAPHATSKVRTPEDLTRIGTMGFRGEALASIASVSRLSLRSRTPGAGEGAQIDAQGDLVEPVRPAAGATGTSVTVRNLFFNTPARRKFLKTPPTEQGRCLDTLRELAMSHPHVGFVARAEGRVVVELPPGQSPRERLVAVLGGELAGQLIEVHADPLDGALGSGAGITLWGLIGRPSIARASAAAQHVFVNGRPVKDRTIAHAIKEGFRGLIEPGRYPTAAILIELDPTMVDVNVHPAKTEVRFRDSSLIHGTVLRAIREALRREDLTPSAPGFGLGGGGTHAPGGTGVPPAEYSRSGVLPSSSPGGFADHFQRVEPGASGGVIDFASLRDVLRGPGSTPLVRDLPPTATPLACAPVHEPTLLPAPAPVAALQVHNAYLVTQDEQGMVIIDQHALHERVMFEKLLARVAGGQRLESQRLLTPATIPCGGRGVEAAENLRPLLTRIGIEADAIGPDALAVHAFPTFLFERGVDVAPFMSELLDKASSEGFAPEPEGALSEVLDMMACKAAIKAGNQLCDSERAELLRLRESVERSSNCPHGRPTSIRVSIKELEKRFGRV